MRKNSPRKWLHAILDLLPVILIPVFMVYSHRHVLTESTNVEIDYKYQSNDVNNLDDLIDGNIYSLDSLTLYRTDNGVFYLTFDFLGIGSIETYDNEYVYTDEIRANNYLSSVGNHVEVYFEDDSGVYFNFSNSNAYANFAIEDTVTLSNVIFIYNDIQIYDYLYAYGYLPNYTDFNIIDNVVVEDTNSTITNAFLNNFNGTIENYFNFGNTFNFQSIWSWINTNIFLSNAPQIMYSIWCIVCYEFLVDLLFIFYSFFMFFIDFCTNLIDRFYVKCSGGK